MNRFRATNENIPRWMNVVRAISTEGFGRIRYHTAVRQHLDDDPTFLPYLNGRSDSLPEFYVNRVKKDLGGLWDYLPDGALYHDPNAYLKAQTLPPAQEIALSLPISS
jgi:hypothetical protein